MKYVVIAFALGTVGLGISIARHPTTSLTAMTRTYPADCVVAIAGAPGYLPRAAVAIENKTRQPFRVSVEGRDGLGLRSVELGRVGAREQKVFPHALPAGRNIVTAAADEAPLRTLRQIIYVNNHGPETCRRRYYWPVE
jgi:hypothetical protein